MILVTVSGMSISVTFAQPSPNRYLGIDVTPSVKVILVSPVFVNAPTTVLLLSLAISDLTVISLRLGAVSMHLLLIVVRVVGRYTSLRLSHEQNE